MDLTRGMPLGFRSICVKMGERCSSLSAAASSISFQFSNVISGSGVVMVVRPDISASSDPRKPGPSLVFSSPTSIQVGFIPIAYTHLRAHETKANLVCRLLLEKKKQKKKK